jgi:anti-sigma-K factor RskA
VISCHDADVLAAALSVGSIDAEDQSTLQQHLSTCADCRRVASEYLAAAARLPLALEPRQPSPELRGRLMRAVYAEAEQLDRQAAASERGEGWRRLWARVPSARGFTVLAAAAMVAVIAVTAWSVSNGQKAAPTPVAVTVAGTTTAPAAHGQVVYDRGGTTAVLTVAGLPAPATIAGGDAVYEVWLVRANGTVVAAAFLNKEPDGSWRAAMHADLTQYTTVAATVEPPGGSHSPTGARVIQAVLSGS